MYTVNINKQLLQKYLTTSCVYYCNLGLGVAATFLAPILLDFVKAFETDTQSISLIITISRAICLISALAFGLIFNYVNRHLLVTFLVFLIGVTGMSLPHSTGLLSFSVLSIVQNICSGGYLTAQVVWIIEIWKDAAVPYIQAQHFFFAFGCIFPPLIFAPYLCSNSDSENFHVLTNYGNAINSTNATIFLESTASAINSLEKLYIPCAICGGIIAFGAVLLLVNYYAFNGMSRCSAASSTESQETVMERNDKGSETKSTEGDDSNENTSPETNNTIKKVILIILASSLIGGVESMEGITMSFLPVFGHYSDLHLSNVAGANILSAYSIAYTLCRLLGIIIILKVQPHWILCGNIVIIALANLVLLFFGGTKITMMYIGSIILGMGFSTSVPSVFAYAQLHLHVTNFVGSVLMVAGGTVAAVFPVIIGSFIEKTPSIFMYLNLGCVVVCLVCLFSMMVTMRKTVGKL